MKYNGYKTIPNFYTKSKLYKYYAKIINERVKHIVIYLLKFTKCFCVSQSIKTCSATSIT